MTIAADIKRKRKQWEREVARSRARPHKVHRFGFVEARAGSKMIKTSKRSETYSACGLWMRAGNTGIAAVDDHTFTCLPVEAQCRNCRLNEPRAFRDKWRRITEATDEERTIVEIWLGELARFCSAADALGTHEERGCYFRLSKFGHLMLRCWCGKQSALSVTAWSVAISTIDPVGVIRDELFARVLDGAVNDREQRDRHRVLAGRVREVLG